MHRSEITLHTPVRAEVGEMNPAKCDAVDYIQFLVAAQSEIYLQRSGAVSTGITASSSP